MIYISGSNAILGGMRAETQSENHSESEVFGFNKNIEYNRFIPAPLIRRMSGILRMSTASAFQCMQKTNIENPDAIIVGTGLGCLTDTEKFLSSIWEENEGILSPTGFIQSTHNTLAGQIALISGCNNYNSTYSDRGFSFENALMDGIMHINEGKSNVLVGGADELTPALEQVLIELKCTNDKSELGEGSVFFMLKNEKEKDNTCLIDFSTYYSQSESTELTIGEFLSKNAIGTNEIGAVIIGDHSMVKTLSNAISNLFKDEIPIQNYPEISGMYFTDSAFGLHLGCEIVKNKVPNLSLKNRSKKVLVANYTTYHSLSLYLLSE